MQRNCSRRTWFFLSGISLNKVVSRFGDCLHLRGCVGLCLALWCIHRIQLLLGTSRGIRRGHRHRQNHHCHRQNHHCHRQNCTAGITDGGLSREASVKEASDLASVLFMYLDPWIPLRESWSKNEQAHTITLRIDTFTPHSLLHCFALCPI